MSRKFKLSYDLELEDHRDLGMGITVLGNSNFKYASLHFYSGEQTFYLNVTGTRLFDSDIDRYNDELSKLLMSMTEANNYLKANK